MINYYLNVAYKYNLVNRHAEITRQPERAKSVSLTLSFYKCPGVTGSNDSPPPPFHDSPGEMTEMTRLK